jgi:methionyl-tRNA formyltransferase
MMGDGLYRVVFMGTPDFAVPSLRALAARSDCVVAAVVTQPDKPVGRKRVLTPPPVKRVAQELGLSVWQPQKVGADDVINQLREVKPDVIVTAAYGQLLPQRLLDIPTRGCLNVHASLLPRWRGAAPIHRAILAGDAETGVTIMEMVRALDAGPIVGVEKVAIAEDDNVGTLHDRLAEVGARLLMQVLPGYLDGSITPTPQPEEGVTYADRILRSDEFVDWRRPTDAVYNHIRGLSPWPGAVTTWNGLDVKIWAAERVPGEVIGSAPAEPGQVRNVAGVGICVRTGDGWLKLKQVQPSGKRPMSADDWFRGIAAETVQFQASEVKA